MTTSWFTVREFARFSGYSRQRLYQLWSTGDGPPRDRVKEPGRAWQVRIPRREAFEWLERHRLKVNEGRRLRAEAYREALAALQRRAEAYGAAAGSKAPAAVTASRGAA